MLRTVSLRLLFGSCYGLLMKIVTKFMKVVVVLTNVLLSFFFLILNFQYDVGKLRMWNFFYVIQ